MPRGGARNRSGPAADPNSERSERRGYKLTALPAQGYDGPVPRFPLPKRAVYNIYFEDKKRVKEFDGGATEELHERELALWEWAWRTPQACAWSMPSEAWRTYSVAMWVRTAVICESSDATAADKNSLHRFSDQIGLTTAGLAEMGWQVAVDEVAAKAVSSPKAAEDDVDDPRARLGLVSGGGA